MKLIEAVFGTEIQNHLRIPKPLQNGQQSGWQMEPIQYQKISVHMMTLEDIVYDKQDSMVSSTWLF